MWRFLNGVWRNLTGDDENAGGRTVVDTPPDAGINRQLHRTIKKVGEDIEALRFNTAIAELIKLNNELGKLPHTPRGVAEAFTLLLSPFAPHMAEELWHTLGHADSVQKAAWPTFDPALLVESTIELPVQVNGKLRDKLTIAADADEGTVFAAVEASEKVRPWIEGKAINKRLYVSKKLVNYVVT